MSKRRKIRTATQELRKWAIENCVTSEDELKKRFYACIEEPDKIEAVNYYKKIKFQQFIASIRKKEKRVAFPVEGEDGIRYVHIIPGTKDLDAVMKIEKRMLKNWKGYNKSHKPIKQYRQELAEQQSLDFGKLQGEQ